MARPLPASTALGFLLSQVKKTTSGAAKLSLPDIKSVVKKPVQPAKATPTINVTRKGARQHNTRKEWITVGGKRIYVKSTYEKNFTFYLEWLKQRGEIMDWFYEPHTFWFGGIKRGTNNYKPDFKVINLNRTETWYEVKGYMDKKSMTKLKRMKKYHPAVVLRLIDKTWFRHNGPKLRAIVPGWA